MTDEELLLRIRGRLSIGWAKWLRHCPPGGAEAWVYDKGNQGEGRMEIVYPINPKDGGRSPLQGYCLIGAGMAMPGNMSSIPDEDDRTARVLGFYDSFATVKWNNAPERTYDEVMALVDARLAELQTKPLLERFKLEPQVEEVA